MAVAQNFVDVTTYPQKENEKETKLGLERMNSASS